MLEKSTYQSLLKNKLVILCLAIVVATIALTALFQSASLLVMGIGFPAACIVGIIFFLSWVPPKLIPKPTKVEIKADPKELIADGKSKSFITIQLLDKKGKPIAATTDTEVKLTTTGGKLESAAVKIPKGAEKAQTVLISSTESGKVDLAADASGLESIDIKLNFMAKPRFCMGCGSRLAAKGAACKECGASPADFGGPETRTCHCGAVIPATAKFCSECGAKQAPIEA